MPPLAVTDKSCCRLSLPAASSSIEMQVSNADLRSACPQQTDAFERCMARRDRDCTEERVALERCAQATVDAVRAINSACGDLYAAYETCCRRSARLADCEVPAQTFWQCAERASPTPLVTGSGDGSTVR